MITPYSDCFQTNGDPTWKTRLDAFIGAAQVKFFSNGILWEPACETNFNCDIDQFCFKGFLAQYLALTSQLAPYTAAGIIPLLESSATAAAKFCNQGNNGTECTMWWTTTQGPVTLGVGQQMSALNVFNSNMFKFMGATVDSSVSGGTSQGNPNAGAPSSDQLLVYYFYILKTHFGLIVLGLSLPLREIKFWQEY